MGIGTIPFDHRRWYLYFSECPKNTNTGITMKVKKRVIMDWLLSRRLTLGLIYIILISRLCISSQE